MGPNEQNQHFAELRQKICLHIYVVVLLTCLPSLDGKLERFVTKKWQTRVRQTIECRVNAAHDGLFYPELVTCEKSLLLIEGHLN